MCPFCSFKFHQMKRMQNCRCTQYTYFTGNSFTLNNIVRISSCLHCLHSFLNITSHQSSLNRFLVCSYVWLCCFVFFWFSETFLTDTRIKDDIQLTRTWSWSAVLLLLLLLGRPAAENIYQLFQILKCDTLGMREGEREHHNVIYCPHAERVAAVHPCVCAACWWVEPSVVQLELWVADF